MKIILLSYFVLNFVVADVPMGWMELHVSRHEKYEDVDPEFRQWIESEDPSIKYYTKFMVIKNPGQFNFHALAFYDMMTR